MLCNLDETKGHPAFVQSLFLWLLSSQPNNLMPFQTALHRYDPSRLITIASV